MTNLPQSMIEAGRDAAISTLVLTKRDKTTKDVEALVKSIYRAMRPHDPAGQWRPFETAPRDGKPFLAYTISRAPGDAAPTYRHEIAHWSGSHFYAWHGIPTHWQPLPDPPPQLREPSDD